MRPTSRLPPAVCFEFVLHRTTAQVGVVTGVCTVGVETHKTVRLAEGKFLAAPAGDFRPATDDEIKKRHRVAATIRPLILPVL